MKSIASRFTALIIVAIIVSVAIIGATSMLTIASQADEEAVEQINLTCVNEAQRINSTLQDIEHSVDIEVSYALGNLDDPDRFFSDEDYRAAYTALVEDLFIDIAGGTNGAVSFYFRYNAEEIPSTQGFLYGRSAADSGFEKLELTDLSLYDPDDDEHVGWYYIPLRNGEPIWLKPYHNKNLGIYMISYVVPVFAGDHFIGVIGMDVNFQVVVDQLQSLHLYENGFAALVDPDGTIYYHPSLAYGSRVDGSDADLPDIHQFLGGQGSEGDLADYRYGTQEKRLAYQALVNGMDLALVAPADDIDAQRNQLLVRILLATLAIIAVFAGVAVASSRRLLRPLNDLTAAASEVARGNLDVPLPEGQATEVATLIDAYQATVERMREQMDVIDKMAHTDSLTGLKNKVAYDEAVEKLTADIEQGQARFALVMIDVNDLKGINDTYGHECGDVYLRTASAAIVDVFAGCPVFRIGGDEFVVLLEGPAKIADAVGELDDLEARVLRSQRSDKEPWERLSMAYGFASFDGTLDHFVSDVFARADAAMYEKKQAMKSR